MTGRSRQILSRFPAHMEATNPGKQFEAVVDALSSGLDAESADLARVRRSHRLADAAELTDLLLIAARHGITRGELAILFTRFDVAQTALAALSQAASDADRDKFAAQLTALWGIDAATPVLPLYAPAGAPPDLNAARTRLINSAAQALVRPRLLDALRTRVAGIAAIHQQGNGTVRAVLTGAANALDLDIVEPIQNSDDHFWHAVEAHDRIVLTMPAGAVEAAFNPAREVIGMEENPIERNTSDAVARHHAELFSVVRRGFDRVLLQVRVMGKDNKTVGPMVVNREEGLGVGFALAVPSGQTLTFTEDGRALLENVDMTAFAYAWQGACFAGDDVRPADFTFDRGDTVFAQASPPGALDPDFNFPHAGDSLPVPGIEVGETRLAFFVQQAYYSGEDGDPPTTVLVTPRYAVGFLDDSVFAPDGEDPPPSALVALSWLEHRAFCFRVLLPPRFRNFTPADPDGQETCQRVLQALNRFRPAGVEARVEFNDDRWVLGQGVLSGVAADNLLADVQAGTVLWQSP